MEEVLIPTSGTRGCYSDRPAGNSQSEDKVSDIDRLVRDSVILTMDLYSSPESHGDQSCKQFRDEKLMERFALL